MEIDFKDPKYYTNRELSWVLFDYRVLNFKGYGKCGLYQKRHCGHDSHGAVKSAACGDP